MTDLTIAVIAIIVAAVCILVVCVLLFILNYHQMLLVNEVNKRLSMMASEAIEKERLTMQEYEEYLRSVESAVGQGERQAEEIDYNSGFNPHTYQKEDEEE